jgi:hypothetical protein
VNFLISFLMLPVFGLPAHFKALPDPHRWCALTLRDPTHPHLGPARSRARRSSDNRSGWIAEESATRGDGSTGSRGARSSGCASSRDSPRPGQRSTRRRTIKRRKRRKRIGGRFSPIGGSLHPRHRSRLWWQENHRLGQDQAVYDGGGTSRERRGGSRGGRARDFSGNFEEEEAGLLLLEVRSCFSRGRVLDGWGYDTLFSCLQGDANHAPSHQPRC